MRQMLIVSAVVVLSLLASHPALAQQADNSMSFFVTSVGSGDGGNLGGLMGADAHCQQLATAAGAGSRTWRAYLSLTHAALTVNARDRIGAGPWYNSRGVLIARDVEELHSDSANINNQTALTERGEMVNPVPRGDAPNRHDILTGSQPDGTAWPFALMDLLNFDAHNLTCANWTSNSDDHLVMLGHHDRAGNVGFSPWNAAHPSVGCSEAALPRTGSGGLFYCFAID